ncbi:MAG TPA: glycerophosphodiester phosphodiesterase family protein [Chloroflexota bacterium]|nr:glycerophosphodiester phosphodiesterase family protein [Chloroflexota bacterium]
MIFATARSPLIGAHRGASGQAPENTMAAFDLAVAQGAELIECDVHCTMDGQLVVHHDFTLARTAQQNLEIGRLTMRELLRMDVGAWRGAGWTGQRIPTLDEVLDRYGARVFLNVEIKVDTRPYPGIEEAVVGAIRERQLAQRVIVSSFNGETVARLRAIDPMLCTGLLSDDRPEASLERACQLGANALHLEAGLITAPRLRQAHARGLGLLAWTVDDQVEMVRLVDLGVDAVVSNYPEQLRDVVLSRRRS